MTYDLGFDFYCSPYEEGWKGALTSMLFLRWCQRPLVFLVK